MAMDADSLQSPDYRYPILYPFNQVRCSFKPGARADIDKLTPVYGYAFPSRAVVGSPTNPQVLFEREFTG